MALRGYLRFPTIYRDRIVFVSEDDLWLVSSEGGRAERLTAGVGRASYPQFSRDGELLAFVGREEGTAEVYVMSAHGGPAQRLTFQASPSCRVLGWSPTNDAIVYASAAGQFTNDFHVIYAISPQGGLPRQLPLGMANALSYGPDGGVVLGRNMKEPAYWKRYRGGMVGHLWSDVEGSGSFERLLRLHGNLAGPCWIDKRIYFISDHEGIGNIYSCTPHGEDLQRHTQQSTYYARHLATDGKRLVFTSGADLYLYDPALDEVTYVDVTLPSQRTQLNRKFVSPEYYLDTLTIHPQGHAIALTTRGKAFSFSNWEGAVLQHGERDGVRYRFLDWLYDGKRLVAICDAPGREALVVFDPETGEDRLLSNLEFGRVSGLAVSPSEPIVALTNHRNELLLVNIDTSQSILLDSSDYAQISSLAWSSDGTWLAYSFALSSQRRAIKLADMVSGQTHIVTDPVLEDVSPSFDPDGKYLYFLGYRTFNPVRDSMQFEFSFPRGVTPYAIPLRQDLRSPFILESKLLASKSEPATRKLDTTNGEARQQENGHHEEGKAESAPKPTRSLHIDLEGITARAIPFPTGEARYRAVRALRGKVIFHVMPVQGALQEGNDSSKGWIECFDFETQKNDKIIDNVSEFSLSRDCKMFLYRSRSRFRVIKVGEKPPRNENNELSGRESGWLDLSRVKVSIQPAAEWRQMFDEAWRLQREQFWTEDMSGVDWDAIYALYAPLVERVGSRSELSDLIHEVQGELGTSHAYEYGGDMRQGRYYSQGFLGVDWYFDQADQRYRIAHIVRGDPSDKTATSPFTTPGIHVNVCDAVLAVNGQKVDATCSPQELLVNQAGREVQLTIEHWQSKERRVVTLMALSSESKARYRDWVEENRAYVHERSQQRVGYLHVPDMKAKGYAEFHRGYLAEYDYPALIIDVRWNGGGNVSGLLLEKLGRKRLGYKFPRWGKPIPYPKESPRGPMVALTNEHAGSDGDIFSHSFKLMKLGPLIGKRTWGGVIGIAPRHNLVDGSLTTQPEYANWFHDVGWNVENYGTDPDIEVDTAPQDYVQHRDPQLDRAILEALRLIEECPTLEPRPGERPLKNWQLIEELPQQEIIASESQ